MSDQNKSPSEKTGVLRGALAGSGSSLQESLFGLWGGVAYGLVSPAVGHPLDTVKVSGLFHG
jgi:hypothetical protein